MAWNRLLAWPAVAGTLMFIASTVAANTDEGPQWQRSGAVQGRLLAATTAVGSEPELRLGVQLRMDDGWKIYWRTPGESGLAPKFDWSGSTNLSGAIVRYPAPHRFEYAGIQSNGYKGDVVLPVVAQVQRPGVPVDAQVKVDVLVCSTTCVPQSLVLARRLAAGAAAPNAQAELVQRSFDQLPGDGLRYGLQVASAEVIERDGTTSLVLRASAADAFAQPETFVEGLSQDVVLAAPIVELSDGGRAASFRYELQSTNSAEHLRDSRLTVTLVDGFRSAEATVQVKSATASRAALLPMLAIALLGGFILNLMPCVLPVLSLKLLSAVSTAERRSGKVRAGFLASAAGNVFSFMLLASAAIVLKAAGVAIGWGVQFQQPVFLVFMVILVSLFAANLWGFFEVPLPRFFADAASGPAGASNSLTGNFITGAFATLLATPCSAPFLGTAVGFALAGGSWDIAAVFLALGVGMASPYLVVAVFPGLARLLPRPGMWMVKLRVVLGFALAATGVWLLWVMAAQVGALQATAAGILVLMLWGLLASHHRMAAATASQRWRTGAATAALVVLAFAIPLRSGPPVAQTHAEEAHAWRAFNEQDIQRDVSQGRTVFVNVTADWCVTCQVNKRAVLYREPVSERLFNDASVVAMQADWTNPDKGIAGYLASFGKYGIPFNVVYGPGAPNGIVLSEVLTPQGVLDALAHARAEQARTLSSSAL